MQRILVFGMTENPGGVESFLMNYYRHFDRNSLQLDFLCNSYNKIAFEDEIIELGGRCFHICARSRSYLRYTRELNNLFKKHAAEWSAIWVNVCSLANIDYLKAARKYGIEKRIIHSHNSKNMDSWIRGILHNINKGCIKNYATDFWACSDDAARWFYNQELINKTVIIKNSIDVEGFIYSPEKRDIIRKNTGLQGKLVIGNIGRLHFQKNQTFVIDIFKEVHRQIENSVLVLVGQGEDEKSLREQAHRYGISDNVIFTGVQSDIQGWLSAFDVFLFPSRFEGLGIAGLEAQANGLPVLASYGVIPDELKVNDNFAFIKLEENVDKWASELIRMSHLQRENIETININFNKRGYNLSKEAERLQALLLAKQV